MAGDNELTRMAREVSELNRRSGFAREDEQPTDSSDWSPPAASPEEGPGQPQKTNKPTSVALPTGKETSSGGLSRGGETSVGASNTVPTADPGPPRFSGVDLDAKIAVVSQSSGIPLLDSEVQSIAAICLNALQRHFIGVLTSTGSTHGIAINVEETPSRPVNGQIPIPFEEPKRGKRVK